MEAKVRARSSHRLSLLFRRARMGHRRQCRQIHRAVSAHFRVREVPPISGGVAEVQVVVARSDRATLRVTTRS